MEYAEDLETAEGAVLGSIMLEANRCLPLAIKNGVAADWFSHDTEALVWCAILDLWSERKPVDAISVLECARRIAARPKHPQSSVKISAADIQAMIDVVASTSHFEHYLRIVSSATLVRRIKKAGARFSDEISDGGDVEFAANALLSRITQIVGMTTAGRTIDVASVLEKIRAEYAAAHQKRVVEKDLDYTPGIPLPWRTPNVALQGVQEGLYYLGARPSVGKTAFMVNLLRFWCERGIRVAFNSLDMAVKPMLKRPISELSRVSLAKASFGTTSHTDLEAMNRAIDGERDADGNIVRKGVKDWGLTLMQERDVGAFRAWCMAAKAAGALDVAIVDFVQLLETRARYANENEKLERISGVLKSIAIDLDIPVIALSQLNRACEEDGGRVPTASDLRGSGALEADATSVWILHADKDVIKSWDEGAKPLGLTPSNSEIEFKGIAPVRFILAKNQNGQAGQDVWFPFVFYKKYCAFMLGDYEAKPLETITGQGATRKTIKDFSPRYAKVTHDWRCDPLECALYKNGTLTGYDLAVDRFLLQ